MSRLIGPVRQMCYMSLTWKMKDPMYLPIRILYKSKADGEID